MELEKHFKMGDHVKVIGGRFEGDTGLIVRVEDTVVLFSDLTMHEVRHLSNTSRCICLVPAALFYYKFPLSKTDTFVWSLLHCFTVN